MRRPPALTAFLLAAALVPATPAAAKEVVGVSVCGASGCVDRSALIGPQRGPDSGLLDIGSVSVADPGRAPFVRLHLHIGDRGGGTAFGTSKLIALPRQGVVRSDDGVWHLLPAAQATLVRRLARGIPRLPATALTPFRPSGPPIPESSPWVAQPAARHIGAAGDGGPPAAVLAGGAAAVLLAALGGAAALRRRRHHGLTEASPSG